MSDLAEAVGELGAWLPRAAALIAEPDTDGTSATGGKPGSQPPWNAAAAAALFGAHAEIRDVEAVFRHLVTGRYAPRRSWSDGNTLAALEAIVKLSHAVPHAEVKRAARDLARCATVIMQLPSVDEAERARRIEADCHYCGFGMLWLYPREGLVACLRGGLCTDSDGKPPRGWLRRDRFGEPSIEWADGLVT